MSHPLRLNSFERSLMATVAEGVSPLMFSFRCSSTTQFSAPLMSRSLCLVEDPYFATPLLKYRLVPCASIASPIRFNARTYAAVRMSVFCSAIKL